MRPPLIEPTRPATPFQRWAPPISVFLAAIVIYLPALDNEFVSWDDDHYIYSNNQLVHEKGLADIWTNVKHTRYPNVRDSKNGKVLKDSTHQYYPLLFTLFWIEHRLYGDNPSVFKEDMEARGYHVTSMVLHAINSVILLLLLHRLGVGLWPAWLVAALFAVHPMNVASVAWAAERKNLVSLFFYMLAMLSYLRFRRGGGWGFYAGTFVLFQCALWSKTVALTFPVVLLLTERLISRRWDPRSLLRVGPLFVLSIIAASTTAYVEDRNRKVPLVTHQRPFVIAAGAWFYPVKLIAPVHQLPIYHLWNPDPIHYERWHPSSDLKWWIPLVGLAAAGWALFHWRRKITEVLGPHVWWGLGFYLVTQCPMLGFKNINIFQFSYVQDHYIYNGCAGVFLVLATALDALPRRLSAHRFAGRAVAVLACAALAVYGAKTWHYSDVWQNSETFWTTTLAKNPGCWAGWYNLGNQYKRQSDKFAGQGDAAQAQTYVNKAVEHYAGAITAKINLHNAYEVLDALLRKLDRKADLERFCDKEIAVDPDIANPYYYKGFLRQEEGKYAEALEMYQKALNPKSKRLEADTAHNAGIGAGVCLMKLERWNDAIRYFEKAVEMLPRKYEVRMNLGICYLKLNRLDEAEAQYREALKLKKDGTAQQHLDEIQRRRQGNP